MDFRTLRYFLTVAEELNFTHAAEKLQMSQPPLSAVIRDMENDLGVQLFIRGKRHLTLTEEGAHLKQRASQILDLCEKTRYELGAMAGDVSGKIYLATIGGRAPYLLTDWITGFREEYPNVSFDLWNGSSDEVIDRIRRGLADAGIAAVPYDDEHCLGTEIAKEPWCVLLKETHPLAMEYKTVIPLSALDGVPAAIPQRRSRAEAVRAWFAEKGVALNELCTISHYADALAIARSGAGVSIFPMTTPDPGEGIVVLPITDPARYIQYVLLQPRFSRTAGTVAELFLDYVQDMLEDARRNGTAEDPYQVPQGAVLM